MLEAHFEIEREDEGFVTAETSEWYRGIAHKVTQGKSLQVHRKNARMTLQELSERTGIAVGNLSAMEHDKRALGRKTAMKLAQALGVDYRLLL